MKSPFFLKKKKKRQNKKHEVRKYTRTPYYGSVGVRTKSFLN